MKKLPQNIYYWGSLDKNKQKVVFYGTPSFAVSGLKHLVEKGINVVAVVTAPDRKAGRGQKLQYSDVKKYAKEVNLPVYQPLNLKSESFQKILSDLNPDIQVVIAFRMLPEKVWNYPKLGTYNVHASLLPNYRGAAPINWTIYNGEKKSGVTTFKLKHEIDTGDLALQKEMDIHEMDDVTTVYNKLANLGAEAIYETLLKVFSDKMELIPQAEIENIRLAPKITKEDLFIKSTDNANQIHNMVRAFSPYPGARIIIDKKIVKILRTKKTEMEASSNNFMLFQEENNLFLNCKDFKLQVLEAQFEGKRRMLDHEIINGRLLSL